MDLNMHLDEADAPTVAAIADRAVRLANPGMRHYTRGQLDVRRTGVRHDITCVHLNAKPLRLQALLAAPDREFLREIAAILDHFDPLTGELTGKVALRFAA